MSETNSESCETLPLTAEQNAALQPDALLKKRTDNAEAVRAFAGERALEHVVPGDGNCWLSSLNLLLPEPVSRGDIVGFFTKNPEQYGFYLWGAAPELVLAQLNADERAAHSIVADSANMPSMEPQDVDTRKAWDKAFQEGYLSAMLRDGVWGTTREMLAWVTLNQKSNLIILEASPESGDATGTYVIQARPGCKDGPLCQPMNVRGVLEALVTENPPIGRDDEDAYFMYEKKKFTVLIHHLNHYNRLLRRKKPARAFTVVRNYENHYTSLYLYLVA
jgi:hypothetical protein